MEAVIFIGLQGAGKSTFYRERFFATHMRINLDMLKTRRLGLHQEFNAAFETTKLPERPDYERANAFLISARRRALSEELP